MHINHFTDLRVYQASLALARPLFEVSKKWPAEERFALTDQIRRASRVPKKSAPSFVLRFPFSEAA